MVRRVTRSSAKKQAEEVESKEKEANSNSLALSDDSDFEDSIKRQPRKAKSKVGNGASTSTSHKSTTAVVVDKKPEPRSSIKAERGQNAKNNKTDQKGIRTKRPLRSNDAVDEEAVPSKRKKVKEVEESKDEIIKDHVSKSFKKTERIDSKNAKKVQYDDQKIVKTSYDYMNNKEKQATTLPEKSVPENKPTFSEQDENDKKKLIRALLEKYECPVQDKEASKGNQIVKHDSNSDDSDSEDDWEEVPEIPQEEYKIPEEGLQITVPKDDLDGIALRHKRGKDPHYYIRSEINRRKKEMYYLMHQVHVMCLFARGIQLNKILKSKKLLEEALLNLPKRSFPHKRVDFFFLDQFLPWLGRTFKVDKSIANGDDFSLNDLETKLSKLLKEKKELSMDMLVFIAILLLRALGMNVRLMYSLQPMSIKVPFCEKIHKGREEDYDISVGKTINSSAEKSTDAKSKATKAAKLNSKKLDINKKTGQNKSSTMDGKAVGGKIVSSDSESEDESLTYLLRNTRQFWLEVFEEESQKWVPINVDNLTYLCTSDFERNAAKPMTYVLSFDSNQAVKDLTRRYASSWLIKTTKLRAETDWWDKVLKPFKGKNTLLDEEEEEELDQAILNSAVPNSLNDLKGHPLYAIEKHLLKFEALYPPNPPVHSFIKGTPVYLREYVHTLHSVNTWKKRGRVVKKGETPYKIVKSRPTFDKIERRMRAPEPLELFGEWQTEPYVPPVAKDGKVPRNDYGNVELFVPEMLPMGTVHIQLPGLLRVAKKLEIDCAPALTGFEYSRGGVHPLFDGFVVCKEFEAVLVDSWIADQEETRRRNAEKCRARARSNWLRLFRLFKIRKRLMKKYNWKSIGSSEETPSISPRK